MNSGSTAPDITFSFWNCEISAPADWRELKRNEDVLVIGSPDNSERATISEMSFRGDVTLDQFKRLCAHRLSAEKRYLVNGVVNASDPLREGNSFEMLFSGVDKSVPRIFSGRLHCANRLVITLYVEAVGIEPQQHFVTYDRLVKKLRRK